MFRFAYANMNSVSASAAAANCAEAVSSCAANTCAGNAANMLKMDAALAASISICSLLLDLRVLGLSILGLIIIRRAEALGRSQA